jgi:predicted permease
MAARILQIILPVFTIVAGGWLYGKLRATDTTGLNRLNMDVFVPALILGALATRRFDASQNGALVLGGVAVILGSGLLAWPIARWLRADPRTFVPPMMFNNSGNMGLPLAVLAFGEASLPAAVALFVASNLLHFTLGASLVRRDAHFGRILLSPIVLATALGAGLGTSGAILPAWVALTLEMLGDVAVPLMLFTLGVRMAATAIRGWRVGLAGALVRPLAGLAIAIPLGAILRLGPTQLGMLYVFASLPPAVLNFLIAEEYRQEPEKVASIVLLGHLASLFFVPLGLALAFRAG